jgi:aryl-alcohol dehydrogenase-like predicted oxidoreductase
MESFILGGTPGDRHQAFSRDRRPVSRIGFGCYALGGAYGSGDPWSWVDLIREAYRLGVTFFDTADQYGSAEEVLGRAVEPFRDQVTIATKVGVTDGGGRDTSPEHVRRSCEASLRRLGTDHIELYQIHFDDPSTPVADTVGALEDLKERGLIGHYGVGHLPLPRVREYARVGSPASVLFELSPAARMARRDILPLCLEKGVAGIAFSPTGRGLLTGAINPGHRFAAGDIRALDALFQRERFISGLRIRDRLVEVGRHLGKTPAQMAIAWTLAQPGVAAVLTGPSRLEHLKENLGGAGWEFPPDALAKMDRFFEDEENLVRAESIQAVGAILASPLPKEGESPYRDLLYVMETAIEHGLVTEEAILPLAGRLFATRKEAKAAYHPSLEDIRRDLKAVIGKDEGTEGMA